MEASCNILEPMKEPASAPPSITGNGRPRPPLPAMPDFKELRRIAEICEIPFSYRNAQKEKRLDAFYRKMRQDYFRGEGIESMAVIEGGANAVAVVLMGKGEVTVCFKGSDALNMRDWGKGLNYGMAEIDQETGAKVHAGFLNDIRAEKGIQKAQVVTIDAHGHAVETTDSAGWNQNRNQSIEQLVCDHVARVLKASPGTRVNLCGFSSGGVRSSMVAYALLKQDPTWAENMHLYTFGASRVGNVVFTHTLEDALKERCVRVAIIGDHVVSLPRRPTGEDPKHDHYYHTNSNSILFTFRGDRELTPDERSRVGTVIQLERPAPDEWKRLAGWVGSWTGLGRLVSLPDPNYDIRHHLYHYQEALDDVLAPEMKSGQGWQFVHRPAIAEPSAQALQQSEVPVVNTNKIFVDLEKLHTSLMRAERSSGRARDMTDNKPINDALDVLDPVLKAHCPSLVPYLATPKELGQKPRTTPYTAQEAQYLEQAITRISDILHDKDSPRIRELHAQAEYSDELAHALLKRYTVLLPKVEAATSVDVDMQAKRRSWKDELADQVLAHPATRIALSNSVVIAAVDFFDRMLEAVREERGQRK